MPVVYYPRKPLPTFPPPQPPVMGPALDWLTHWVRHR